MDNKKTASKKTATGSKKASRSPKKSKGGLKVKKIKVNFKKLTLKNILVLVAVLIVAFLLAIGYLLYGQKNTSPFLKRVTAVTPFPAALVSGNPVWAYDFLDRVGMLKRYQIEFAATDFDSDDGKEVLKEIKESALEYLIEDKIIAKEAKARGVKVSAEDVNTELENIIASNGGEKTFTETLAKFYGISLNEFKEDVLRPQVLRTKLAEAINSDENIDKAAKSKAEEVYQKAVAKDANFAELAKAYSEDTATAGNGGDLGFFKKGEMVPEFEKAALALKEGEISKPVKTVYGYHIIKVVDKTKDQVKASHILIKVVDFNEWLESKKEELEGKKVLGIIPGIWRLVL